MFVPFLKSSTESSNFNELIIGLFHVLFKIFTRLLHGIVGGAVTPFDGDAFAVRRRIFQNFKKIKEELGVKLHYPDYRSGLNVLFKDF